jgi:tRNA pseudouridine55 synthase
MPDIDGVLIIDKPEGITSHDVIDRVRRALGMRRIGHTGTLDPFATGVLVLCLGKATRLQQFLVGCDKEYIGRVRLGLVTDTHDRTGAPVGPMAASNRVMPEQIEQVMNRWRGARDQVPPMFSAKQQAGVRLYKLARQGQDVPRQPVRITIHELELIQRGEDLIERHPDGTSDFSFRVRCSAGSYVRVLAHDLGQELGCGGHLIELRRTAVGAFHLRDAVPLDEFEQRSWQNQGRDRIIPLGRVPLGMPELVLSEADVARVRHGQAVASPRAIAGRHVKLIDERGELVGIGEPIRGLNTIQPRILLC